MSRKAGDQEDDHPLTDLIDRMEETTSRKLINPVTPAGLPWNPQVAVTQIT